MECLFFVWSCVCVCTCTRYSMCSTNRDILPIPSGEILVRDGILLSVRNGGGRYRICLHYNSCLQAQYFSLYQPLIYMGGIKGCTWMQYWGMWATCVLCPWWPPGLRLKPSPPSQVLPEYYFLVILEYDRTVWKIKFRRLRISILIYLKKDIAWDASGLDDTK